MTNLEETISDALNKLGQEFFMGYYLPSAVFVLLQLFVFGPLWREQTVDFAPTTIKLGDSMSLDQTLLVVALTLLLPALIGMILLGLNHGIVRLVEGKVWWLEYGLLYPLKRLNQARCQANFGKLADLRKTYLQISREVLDAPAGKREECYQLLDGLAQQMEQEHDQVEAKVAHWNLPFDLCRVAPTRFGNTYAQIEEYAYDRYGLDTVLFWPRLRELLSSVEPDLARRMNSHKTLVDLSLNFCVFSVLVIAETVLLLIFKPGWNELLFLSIVLAGLVAYASFYSSAISSLRAMGELIKLSFDFHRTLILDAFHIPLPKNGLEEKLVWIRLAAFIKRGEEYFFPGKIHLK
jgi:hypothetical protein